MIAYLQDRRLWALVVVLSAWTLSAPEALAKGGLKAIKTVVIDPGHGGNNDGARGGHESMEKDLTLAVAYAVRDRLLEDYPDLNVILTRNIDVDLSLPERIHTAHMAGADLFLSLHMNSSLNRQATGVEVFYLSVDKTMPMVTRGEGTWGQHFEDPDVGVPEGAVRHEVRGNWLPIIFDDLALGQAHWDSATLANTLLEELRRACPGCRNRGVRQANFGVLRGSRVPSVVVEFGFLSNPGEERRMVNSKTHRRFAQAISKTVARMDRAFVTKGYANTQ